MTEKIQVPYRSVKAITLGYGLTLFPFLLFSTFLLLAKVVCVLLVILYFWTIFQILKGKPRYFEHTETRYEEKFDLVNLTSVSFTQKMVSFFDEQEGNYVSCSRSFDQVVEREGKEWTLVIQEEIIENTYSLSTALLCDIGENNEEKLSKTSRILVVPKGTLAKLGEEVKNKGLQS
jgi:hypothetical protein